MNFGIKSKIPHDREMWNLLAEKIGAKFIQGDSWENERVVLNYKSREIILISEMKSIGKSRHFESQVKCLVSTKNKFILKIFIENAFTHAGKIFGIHDIELDDSKFDDEFFVKSKRKGYSFS
jgi:hypothetical protein